VHLREQSCYIYTFDWKVNQILHPGFNFHIYLTEEKNKLIFSK
jgi:hypothetical protein